MPFVLLPEDNPAATLGPLVVAKIVAAADPAAAPPVDWPKGYEQAVVVQLQHLVLAVHPVVGGDLDGMPAGPYASLDEVAAAVTGHTGQDCRRMQQADTAPEAQKGGGTSGRDPDRVP
jgi:hypothetical protein